MDDGPGVAGLVIPTSESEGGGLLVVAPPGGVRPTYSRGCWGGKPTRWQVCNGQRTIITQGRRPGSVGRAVSIRCAPSNAGLIVTENARLTKHAASTKSEETAGNWVVGEVLQARVFTPLVPSRRLAHALRVLAHVVHGHEGLVFLLAPHRR